MKRENKDQHREQRDQHVNEAKPNLSLGISFKLGCLGVGGISVLVGNQRRSRTSPTKCRNTGEGRRKHLRNDLGCHEDGLRSSYFASSMIAQPDWE